MEEAKERDEENFLVNYISHTKIGAGEHFCIIYRLLILYIYFFLRFRELKPRGICYLYEFQLWQLLRDSRNFSETADLSAV